MHWSQLQVLQQLEQAKHVPDFNNYLSFIFSKGDNLPLEVGTRSAPAAANPSGAAGGCSVGLAAAEHVLQPNRDHTAMQVCCLASILQLNAVQHSTCLTFRFVFPTSC